MKWLLICITLGLIVFTGTGEIPVRKTLANAVVAAGARPQRGAQKLTRVANNFPGSDLGAKINAADKDLGNAEGEIQVRSGGMISTQVVINPKHTLRFGPGTYTLATELLSEGAFLLKSHTTVIGSGWDTVLVEPPRIGWIVFQSFEDIRTQPVHYGTDSNISISNLQIKGANPGVDGSVRQTITLGNCHNCRVERVWFNATNVIGVQAGGSGLGGNFADTVMIRNNLFTRLAGQAAAVVNGRNIIIDRNTFKDSGRDTRQGMVPIDVEPNDPHDIAQRIEITNNVIDSRGSTFMHGNAILVQNGAATSNFGPVLIKDNTVVGGELVQSSISRIAAGIYVTANVQDVSVINNKITRVAHSGIRLDGTKRSLVSGNTLTSTGTGGIRAFEIMATTDSQILNNVVTVDPNSPLGSSDIVESGNSRNNIYRGNTDGRNALAPTILSRRP